MTNLFVLAALSACAPKAPAVAPAPSPAAVEEPAPEAQPRTGPITLHMAKHLSHLSMAREAVLDGQLDAARGELTWLSEHHEVHALPELYRPFVTWMRETAEAGAQASDTAGIARSVALTADRCGACHAAVRAPVEFTPAPAPDQDPTMAAHMHRHRWGVDRMWEGLIEPDDGSWREGAAMLAEAPLGGEQGEGLAEGAGELAVELHALGRQAQTLKASEDKAELYGQVLAVCSQCHQDYRGR